MPKRNPATLSHKLMRMNLLVAGTALLLACAALVCYDIVTFREVVLRNLSIQAEVLGANSVAALTFGDPDSAERTLGALASAPPVVSACIYTQDGRPFARYTRGGAGRIPPVVQVEGARGGTWLEAGHAMVIRQILFQGRPTGYIFIESDLQLLRERVERYVFISLVVLAASMMVAAAASARLREDILKPIAGLSEAAQAVTQDRNYSMRATVEGAPAELSALLGTFNEMVAQIEQRDRERLAARDELEVRVAQRTAELAAANRELESFSYSVSHDLRAPLRSIDGFSLALMEDYGDRLGEEARGYFDRIRAATRRMGQLIDDMLELARVTRAEMQREPVDLSAIARAIQVDILRCDGDRSVEWVIGGGIEATGDVRLLRVVMDNLLRNAWKYTSKHPTARIEFGQKQTNGSKPVYFVKDDGAGFDPAFAGKLFGAFQRLHSSVDFPGTGVGLATVQRILQRHGGRIWAESQVEKGATFYFVV